MKIYIMIGLPASGKSSYIKENKKSDDLVLSSDSIRAELFGDESVQINNGLVFDTLFKRLLLAIKNKRHDIFIDATSISLKDRKRLLNTIKNYNKAKMIERIGNEVKLERPYKIIGIYFRIDSETLISRDLERNRTVGEKVILRMLERYIKPTLSEGFDEIVQIKENNYSLSNTFLESLKKFLAGDDNLIDVLKNDKYLKESIDCEQTSQWHQEDLFKHLSMILELIPKKIKKQDLKILRLITLFHDIGKPFVRNKKVENLERRGYKYLGGDKFQKKNKEIVSIANYNDYQFLGHEVFGANIFRFNYKKILINENIIDENESELIEVIIRGHLDFHNNEKDFIEIEGEKYEKGSEIFRIGSLFSKFDSEGRIINNQIKNARKNIQ